jgi:hypothetical protein
MSVGAPGLAPSFRWRSNVTALRHDGSFAVCTELTRSHAVRVVPTWSQTCVEPLPGNTPLD